MGALARFYGSTVGKKFVMAVTGLILVGFVVGHMAGNLKLFMGFDSNGVAMLDHYAEMLREIGADFLGRENFLWIVRAALLGTVCLHFLTAFQLVQRNRAGRPQNYVNQRYQSSTLASLTMVIGGIVLLFFIVFHILHFTTGHLHTYGFEHGKVYANVYSAFQHGSLVAIYAIAMMALCLHLYHGTWSVFQTLGIDSKGWNCCLRSFAKALALVVAIGFVLVPFAIYFKFVPSPTPAYYVDDTSDGTH